METQTIAVLGAGNIGRRMIMRLLPCGYSPDRIRAVRKHASASIDAGGVTVPIHTDVNKILDGADIALLCVKPADVPSIGDIVRQSAFQGLWISVAAGLRIERLTSILGTQRIIRAMPNTPLEYGKGITAWFAGHDVTEEDTRAADTQFQHCGLFLCDSTRKGSWTPPRRLPAAVRHSSG